MTTDVLARLLPRRHGRHAQAEFWADDADDSVGELPEAEPEQDETGLADETGPSEAVPDPDDDLTPLPDQDDMPPARVSASMPMSPTANPYGIGASVLADLSDLVIYRHQPSRPATEAEQAEYLTRYGDPRWADLYPAVASGPESDAADDAA